MADINRELNIIRKLNYGGDFFDATADALEKINNDGGSGESGGSVEPLIVNVDMRSLTWGISDKSFTEILSNYRLGVPVYLNGTMDGHTIRILLSTYSVISYGQDYVTQLSGSTVISHGANRVGLYGEDIEIVATMDNSVPDNDCDVYITYNSSVPPITQIDLYQMDENNILEDVSMNKLVDMFNKGGDIICTGAIGDVNYAEVRMTSGSSLPNGDYVLQGNFIHLDNGNPVLCSVVILPNPNGDGIRIGISDFQLQVL